MQTQTPEPPPEDVRMANIQGGAEIEVPVPPAPTLSEKKLDTKITIPDFDGKRKKFQMFDDALGMYFRFHEDQYSGRDNKMIMFVLFQLTLGEAELWRRIYMREKKKHMWEQFWEKFTTAFQTEDEANQVLLDLHNLKQGPGESAETMMMRFRHLVVLGKIPEENNDHIYINYLRNTLSPKLVEKMSLLIDEPEEFEEWVRVAIKHDNV